MEVFGFGCLYTVALFPYHTAIFILSFGSLSKCVVGLLNTWVLWDIVDSHENGLRFLDGGFAWSCINTIRLVKNNDHLAFN